jgi:pyruvate dehydrogenase E2 component (dihydrolipoamide acetyltransferase)
VAQIIGLPKLSPTMEEGVLVRWTKKEGDKVSPGDLVAEVETDKANMDFNIEDDGVLLKLLVKEGDTVKLGAPVAIIGKAGEDVAALVEEAKSAAAAPPAKPAEGKSAAPAKPAARPAAGKPAPGKPGPSAKPGPQAGKAAPQAKPAAGPAAGQSARPASGQAAPAKPASGPSARPASGQAAPARAAAAPAARAPAAPATDDDGQSGSDGEGGAEDSANAPAARKAPREATRPEQDQRGKAAVKPPGTSTQEPPAGGRLLASPLAKTLAIELGIDLRQIAGSGPGGRIIERDVRAAADAAGDQTNGHAAEARADAEAPAAEAEPAEAETQALTVRAPARARPAQDSEDDWEDVPASNVRKRIAARLTEAKRDVPHFYLMRDLDAAPLLAYRQRLNDLLGDRGKISVNDLIVKAVALALRRMPECNASWEGDAIRRYHRVHVGVAVAIPDGLITPVVRDADMKGIGAIAAEVKDLADRAKKRALKMHEITGSTFSVSNLGMFGIERFTAIINPPEGGILAIGTVRDVPVVDPKDPTRLVPGKRMTVTMSCDHRVIDGALGARWLQVVAELIEKPESLAL